MKTYYDGVEDNGIDGTFNWGNNSLNSWNWNPYIKQTNNDPKLIQGSLKVKNVVFWSKQLENSEIQIITKK
jgi:hypothetical protein